MSAALTLATPEHLGKLDPLVAAFHTEENIELDEAARHGALTPLLDGSPHGAVYLIGPPRAPIGYIVITFTWSLEYGGLDALIDEIYIRPGVRGRGIATEVLNGLPRALGDAGVKAIHLEVAKDAAKTQAFYRRAGFKANETRILMTKIL